MKASNLLILGSTVSLPERANTSPLLHTLILYEIILPTFQYHSSINAKVSKLFLLSSLPKYFVYTTFPPPSPHTFHTYRPFHLPRFNYSNKSWCEKLSFLRWLPYFDLSVSYLMFRWPCIVINWRSGDRASW